MGISVSRTYDILKELESKGVVKPQRLGNAVFYSLDKTNEEARLLLRLVRIESGGRRGLKK